VTAPQAFELRRTRWMRFGGGPLLQPVFPLVFVVYSAFVIRNGTPVLLVVPAVALVLWLLGAVAYIRVDDAGIHRRCYLRHDDAWSDIRSIDLRTVSYGRLSNRRIIRVRRDRGRHWLAPATGGTKYNEAFARQLLAAARARGITVSSSDWGGFDE
jgi:hypothetical protein